MTLLDPTLGVGYAFGEKLPSTHMTTIATQQPRALDIVNGGTYTQSAQLSIDGDALKGGGTEPILYTNLKGVPGAGGNGRTVFDHPVDVMAGRTVTLQGTLDAAAASAINYNTTATVTYTGATNLPRLGSRTYTRACSLESGIASYLSSVPGNSWHYSTDGTIAPADFFSSVWVQTYVTGADGHHLYIPLDVIHGSVLDSVSVTLTGGFSVASHVAWPITYPVVEVFQVDPATAVRTTLTSATVTPASQAAYEDRANPITTTLSGIAHTVQSNKQYQVRITGETATNGGIPNALAVFGVTSSYTCTEIHPG